MIDVRGGGVGFSRLSPYLGGQVIALVERDL